MDPNLRYGGEAIFFLGLAFRIATWIFRTVREGAATAADSVIGRRSMLSPAMPPDQHARMMSLINPPDLVPATPEIVHRCPKCGALVHMDVVHGGLGACRKCGFTAGAEGAA